MGLQLSTSRVPFGQKGAAVCLEYEENWRKIQKRPRLVQPLVGELPRFVTALCRFLVLQRTVSSSGEVWDW
jgi:hypothetical protein